jgi:hypothetical protein
VESIAERIDVVRGRMARAARQVGRSPDEITLVGVTKTHPTQTIAAAIESGLRDFGENRVQEAEAKVAELSARSNIRWHLIGHLQTNKAKKAAALFDLVHSVDSVRLADALNRFSLEASGSRTIAPRLPILLQVNVSGEASKEGFALVGWEHNQAAVDAFLRDVEHVLALPGLEVRGLMTIAPWGDEPEESRPTFRSTRRLRDELVRRFPSADWSTLSMGMSDDFEVAITEGATVVRVGRAIFGERG